MFEVERYHIDTKLLPNIELIPGSIRYIIGEYINLSDYKLEDIKIENLDYLYELFKVKFNNVTLTFSIECQKGHLKMAKWLYFRYKIEEYKIKDRTFLNTCQKGHLNVLKWLHDTFDVSIYLLSKLFINVCKCNHLHILKWLHDTFDNTDEDVLNMFYYSCEYGNLRIAKWLHNKFAITREDIFFIDNFWYLNALKINHPTVFSWLNQSFNQQF